MFQWLKSLQENKIRLNFRYADIGSTLQIFSLAEFDALQTRIVEEPAIACIATGFDIGAKRVSHVVNVWYDGQAFCLRDSARDGASPNDGTAPTLIKAVELCGICQMPNGHILHGMTVTKRD